ncbi:MAG TPA: ectonucleotide pyrophosphatase/phosphodiesterase [Chryseolinea sp.]|nr:ectonucleotide pyrophosphatase/phosphodiesterase [Chryseolinea sp.]
MKKVVALFACIVFLPTLLSGQERDDIPYVILISFDGFRFDYPKLFSPPNFQSFAKNGTEAAGLIPSFPSKTFPNHYTLVTGLYPGHHGLVDNSFYDPDRNEYYTMKMRDRVQDPYYYSGTPLWKLAKDNNIRSASFFWVGSELPKEELRPDYFYPYDESIADTLRVDQVLKWLSLPAQERPHFITLYFSSPDHEAHLYGPESDETRGAVMNADRLLGRLIAGVKSTQLPVNIIVVSDHGMLSMKEEPSTYIFLDEIMDIKNRQVKYAVGGTQAHLYVNNDLQCDSLYNALKGKSRKFSVRKQEEFPSGWHYNAVRSGDLLITANPGYYIVERNRSKFEATRKRGSTFGAHGYDPSQVPQMQGIFIANGPHIKSGLKISAFQNIHVYPLIAKILNLPLPEIDGRIEVLENVYQK